MFTITLLTIAFSSAILAGLLPIEFSVVTVFLFAAPHNWFEARYFLSRLPGHWGKLRTFFLVGFAGTLALSATYAVLIISNLYSPLPGIVASIWQSTLLIWVIVLLGIRSVQNPPRNFVWMIPILGLALSVSWFHPLAFSVALVYLHPFLSFWMLDRELYRKRSSWHRPYRFCLILLPAMIVLVWILAGSETHTSCDTDSLTQQISLHAGVSVVSNIPAKCLVATHAFLEMLHYAVWLLAIPALGIRPLAERSRTWRMVGFGLLIAGAGIVASLWVGFAADYSTTREIYFTIAIVHVLAEIPFLIRMT